MAQRETREDEEDGEGWGDEVLARRGGKGEGKKSHGAVLGELHGDFERHLRFVAGGLRGVARAGRDEAAGKWDLLAEMLEVGIREGVGL